MTRVIALAIVLLSGGVAQGAPIKGVVLRSYEPIRGVWVAHIVNVSHKNVVCVNIAVSEHGGVGYSYAYYSRPNPSS